MKKQNKTKQPNNQTKNKWKNLDNHDFRNESKLKLP